MRVPASLHARVHNAEGMNCKLDQVKASIHLPKMENKEEEEGKKEKEDNQKEEDKKEEQSLSSCRRSLMTASSTSAHPS